VRERYKTLRHIETVRNYLNQCVKELLTRQEDHDQSKLESPEVEIFDEYTPKLRETTYGSDEYKSYLKEMQVGLKHHYENNSHHPEHYEAGIDGMDLFDLIEMVCDWKSATLRHNDGDIWESLMINKNRYGIERQLHRILSNTITKIESWEVKNKANES
jgi:hypothetical protein